MKIIASFTYRGIALTGLSPVVNIVDITNILTPTPIVPVSNLMVDVLNGFYAYDFVNYIPGREYTIMIDGGDTLSDENRYKYGIIDKIDFADALTFIKNIEGGKWEILGNQMIFYAEDNTTVVARFNLFNDAGQLSNINVFRRDRVI